MLGMEPDEAWDNGTTFTLHGKTRVRTFSRWAVVERAGADEDWESALDRLVTRLLPIQGSFRKLPDGIGVSLCECVTENSGVFGLGLEKRHLEFMVAIGAEFGQSFVVHDPGRRDGVP